MPLNQSEIATAFTVLLAVTALLVTAQRWRGNVGVTATIAAVAACAVFWLSWGTVDWGSVGASIPVANLVPNTRAMLGVGYLAIIVFALFMSQWRPPQRLSVPLVAGLVTAFLSAYGGSAFKTGLVPEMTVAMIWVSSFAAGLVVFLLVGWPNRWWSWFATFVAAGMLVVSSTPVLFGLGDLRGSVTAQRFLDWGKEAREEGWTWASESQDVDSLMMATGTPTLSARQQMGPDVDAWRKLDPSGNHEDLWNRGGLHVQFEWTDQMGGVRFSQPTPDTIIILASPCEVAQRLTGFRFAISEDPLPQECVQQIDTFRWGGKEYGVYEVAGAG